MALGESGERLTATTINSDNEDRPRKVKEPVRLDRVDILISAPDVAPMSDAARNRVASAHGYP